MCAHLLILTDPKVDRLHKFPGKTLHGRANLLVVVELLNNAHHIRQMEFGDLPQIWK